LVPLSLQVQEEPQLLQSAAFTVGINGRRNRNRIQSFHCLASARRNSALLTPADPHAKNGSGPIAIGDSICTAARDHRAAISVGLAGGFRQRQALYRSGDLRWMYRGEIAVGAIGLVGSPNPFLAVGIGQTRSAGQSGTLDVTQRVPREAMLYATRAMPHTH